jgi:hypothetical protein
MGLCQHCQALGSRRGESLVTRCEVRRHDHAGDLWIVAGERVFVLRVDRVVQAFDAALDTDAPADALARLHEVDGGTFFEHLRAAELDKSSAQWALGKYLYQQRNPIEGLQWIRAAARQGDNPSASQFLNKLDGPNNSLSGPNAVEQQAVMATLNTTDQAGQRKDAEALVAALSPQAKVFVRLPDSSAWLTLNKAQLAELWQATFDRAHHYEYRRNTPELLRVDGTILAFSSIHEHLQRDGSTQHLEIRESAQLSVINGHAQIDQLRLDIRRQEQ